MSAPAAQPASLQRRLPPFSAFPPIVLTSEDMAGRRELRVKVYFAMQSYAIPKWFSASAGRFRIMSVSRKSYLGLQYVVRRTVSRSSRWPFRPPVGTTIRPSGIWFRLPSIRTSRYPTPKKITQKQSAADTHTLGLPPPFRVCFGLLVPIGDD